MSVSIVNVWVSDWQKNSCSVDNNNTFVATVQHCDGSVLEWSGGRYQTKDGTWHPIVGDPDGLKPKAPGFYDGVPGTGDPGHVIFEVPPGCYIVSASTHVWKGPHDSLLGNLGTHKAIVDTRCSEHVCVHLFQPSFWHCSVIQVGEQVLPVLEAHRIITAEQRKNLQNALKQITEKLKPTPFDEHDIAISRTIAKRLAGGK